MFFSTLVAVALLCSCMNCLTDGQECYCVKPHSELKNCTQSNPCQGQSTSKCHPLSYYFMNKSTSDIANDTTFYFLPGDHTLQEVFEFNSSNTTIYNLSLIGIGCNGSKYCVQSKPVAILNCHGKKAGLYFEWIHNLTIAGISIRSCGFKFVSDNRDTPGAVLVVNVTNMHMCGVEIHQSRGWGLFCTSVVGESIINYTYINGSNYTETQKGGNLKIKYYYKIIHDHEMPQRPTHHFNVTNSVISNGSADQHSKHAYAGGIDIYIITIDTVILTLYNVSVINNTGYDGGNIAITYTTLHNSWLSKINISSCHVISGTAHTGGGLYIELILRQESLHRPENTSNSSVNIHVEKTEFLSNTAHGVGGGVYVQMHESKFLSARASICFSECVFKHNSLNDGHSGTAVHVIDFHLPGYINHYLPQYEVRFDNCIFEQNMVNASYDSKDCGTLYVEDSALIIIINSNFSSNMCSGITAIESSLVLEGHIVISNNTAHNGGGMLLCASSVMNLSPNAVVFITHNHAYRFGGGIYAEFECAEAFPPCFYQANNTNTASVHLDENTAAQAGNALYGGSIDYCYIFEDETDNVTSATLFQDIFVIPENNNYSTISSNPYKVCFCIPDGTFVARECIQKLNYTNPLYPGGTINVSVMIAGQRNGTAPGVVVANCKMSGTTLKIGPLQESQIINSSIKCTPLKYTITGNISEKEHDGKILLSVENANNRDVPGPLQTPSHIDITIKPCPYGFELINGMCDCLNILRNRLKNISCDISNGTIKREGSVSWWLGHDDGDHNFTLCQFCPFDFCTTKTIDIHTNDRNYDDQCTFSRSGILCGQCKNNLSVVFGSGHCRHCGKPAIISVLLTLLFAILGIFLVLLLGIFDLNVSDGALNPIIFYMNIIQLNLNLFFHSKKHLSNTQYYVVYFLKVFVAWMNLDLGIETCYYNGMNATVKVALQFVFPMYLWVLAALIIYLSRRYSLIARMAGKSSVKLLATIILFSYTKIVRCIIDVCWASRIYHIANGTTSIVWHLDGRIRYFQREHAILFVFAILVACFTLPYTLSLLFIQCLRKRSHMKPLFWVVRLKPFFDAYTGPYRDRYHFWTGFLLIMRISLFLWIASNTTKGPILNTALINTAAAILLLLNLLRIYKAWQHTAIEAFTYFNLIIFSTGIAYINIKRYSNFVCVFICVGSMFLLFCGVVINNMCKKFSGTTRWGEMKVWLLEKDWPWVKRTRIRPLILRYVTIDSSSSSEDELDPILQNAPPVARYDCYREPLVETSSYS